MSLRIPGGSSRSRSKSPGGRSRSRSRQPIDDVRAPSPPSATDMPGGFAPPPTSSKSDHHSYSSSSRTVSHGPRSDAHESRSHKGKEAESESGSDEDEDEDEIVMDWNDLPPEERPGYVPPSGKNPRSQVPHAQADFTNVSYAPDLTPQFAQYKVRDDIARVGDDAKERAYSASSASAKGAKGSKQQHRLSMTSKPIPKDASMDKRGSHARGYSMSSAPINAMPPMPGGMPYPSAGPMAMMPGLAGMPAFPGDNDIVDPRDYAAVKEVAPKGSSKHSKRDSKQSGRARFADDDDDSEDDVRTVKPHFDDRRSSKHDDRPHLSERSGTWPNGIGHLAMPPLPGGMPPLPGPGQLSINGQAVPFDMPSPGGLHGGMDRLSIHPSGHPPRPMVPGQAPPASPLLEAYKGTYQSMPSPLLMPHFDDNLDDIPSLSHYETRAPRFPDGGHKGRNGDDDDLEPLPMLLRRESHKSQHSDDDGSQSGSSGHRHKDKRRSSKSSKDKDAKVVKLRSSMKKSSGGSSSKSSSKTSYSHTDAKPARAPSGVRVTLYDAEKDAKTIADALGHSRPDLTPLVDILPLLSHDQLMELRAAYKKVCKIQGRGINIAKHVKMKTSGSVGKLLYVLALGRWESEGYWANFWYNSNSSRRELLVEALTGRTNQEIKLIKADFQDKRYDDSLVKCMDKELKADKFRAAVLLALEEKRQEEGDVWPMEYRERDVDALREALRRSQGGETAMLQVVVTRSDAHLREVLRIYERRYGSNFAKEALKRSNNLVGEVIAHILNGVINRGARDALLLNHALMDLSSSGPPDAAAPPPSSSSSSSKGQDRVELLISRLVRMHWDRLQFRKTKEEYRERYGRFLEDDVERYVKGEDMREACLNLCET